MKAANVVLAVGLAILSVFICDIVISYLFYETPYHYSIAPITPFGLIWVCIIAPFAEEYIFRELPFKYLKPNKEKEPLLIILIAVLFGWLHGGYLHIFAQGIAGVAFGYVYVRNGYSYLSAVTAHSLYNFFVAFAIPSVVN